MGAGKSTIGRMLAEELGWRYIDNDAEIAEFSGLMMEELSKISVDELHHHENEYLTDLIQQPGPYIAGAAGSVVDYPQNLELLKSVTPIYLRISLEEIEPRAGLQGVGRANLAGDLAAVLRERFLRRDPIYREIAKYVIELSDDPRSDAERILTFLRKASKAQSPHVYP